MTNQGFAFIYRSAFREEHFLHPSNRQGDATWRDAWIFMILRANWDEGCPQPGIPTGHIQISARGLKEQTALSRSAASRFLARLKDEDMIRVAWETDDRTKPPVFKIANYRHYQNPNKGGTRSGARTGTPGEKPEQSDDSSHHRDVGSTATDRRDAGRDTHRDPGRDVTKEEKNRKNENKNNRLAPEAGATPTDAPFGDSSPSRSEPNDTEDQLEQQVREVEQHWMDLLANIDLTSEERQVLLSSDKREHALSKFRARIRDDGFTVEDLKQILSWALSQYWEDGDRLPWGGHVHPRSILQNGDKARERLLCLRRDQKRNSRPRPEDRGLDFEQREQAEDEAAEQWIDQNF